MRNYPPAPPNPMLPPAEPDLESLVGAEEEAAPALLRAYDELLGVARSPVHVPADVTFANEPE